MKKTYIYGGIALFLAYYLYTGYAKKKNIEEAKKLATDTTVTESGTVPSLATPPLTA